MATVSSGIKQAMVITGKQSKDLAECLDISRQAVANKFNRNQWSAADLATVCMALGCKLTIETPDGQRIPITPQG